MTHYESFTASPAILPRAWHWTSWQPALLHFFLGTLNTFHSCEFSCATILNTAMCLFFFQSRMNQKMVKQRVFFLEIPKEMDSENYFCSCNNEMIALMLKVNYILFRVCKMYFIYIKIPVFLYLICIFSKGTCGIRKLSL